MTPDERLGRALGVLIAQAGISAFTAWIAMLNWPHLFHTHPSFGQVWAVTLAALCLIACTVKGELVGNE